MGLYPVIMCGGAGTRLWPASRPSRPKQFIPLSGNRSLFQETALRVAPLAEDGGRLIVVGGKAHRQAILDQLAEIGIEAQVLLEPEPRDSAAAMAAAAAWTEARDAAGVNVFVASDHHIPDHEGFRAAVTRGAEAAADGRIVTLGVRPTEPSSAYGYIAPEGTDLSPVAAFVEKPDRAAAERYIAGGYLWNSGNFIARANVLLSELRAEAPAVEAAARASLPDDGAVVADLGPGFLAAPKISIDYAVMEKTTRASVLAVDFAWSDLGAWDAVAATGEGDLGAFVFEDAEGCMARACDGVMVAAIGVRNLAIVVERDAVLVCDLSRSQDVKKVVERLKLASPLHLDFQDARAESLTVGAERLARWLRLRALPLWSELVWSASEGFAEGLTLDGRRSPAPARPGSLARLARAFAEAGDLGWGGPWNARLAAAITASGGAGAGDLRDQADRMIALMQTRAAAPSEAAGLIARAAGMDRHPVDSGRLADLGLFAIERGAAEPPALSQVMAASEGDYATGRLFDWAWLRAREASLLRRPDAGALAAALYRRGLDAVDPRRGLALEAAAPGRAQNRRARLRTQAHWLRAALALAELTEGPERARYVADAGRALTALWRFLNDDGLWFETVLEDGQPIEEVASAAALGDILGALRQMHRSAAICFPGGVAPGLA
ncbi:hypothetical protein ASG17_14890 [Brevundimonas sp. Leaf363]|uniref:sugar phosphate nucleotidyltransferase n=1 Tax=Brevundimonas sp. Leaf363 TaxID=1736353 RepID=UPI0006F4CE4C|nr:sugar phosphate nucleotidyltransferase [Brevundimonas sp. Leaf363]KQS52890.1 hypothetical protein ASG17_14890 [Brevundimonas sp. Leaf363]